ncbi:O-antigen ligase family protein [Chelatococcus sp. SYSU_G07232]|uniref:O-antigen ligase family protein n=1 Tax=Chelatococcus albus TaxID=3047466 RepID=A0ABT7AGF5_9HYPH|nr:O-antigen ligase family protein [Chelatococcus sp. SYSU_G07232]MDJ1158185.1 O-antigen ligase family protein [Chelatococcus sp. SYSU_G07232]
MAAIDRAAPLVVAAVVAAIPLIGIVAPQAPAWIIGLTLPFAAALYMREPQRFAIRAAPALAAPGLFFAYAFVSSFFAWKVGFALARVAAIAILALAAAGARDLVCAFAARERDRTVRVFLGAFLLSGALLLVVLERFVTLGFLHGIKDEWLSVYNRPSVVLIILMPAATALGLTRDTLPPRLRLALAGACILVPTLVAWRSESETAQLAGLVAVAAYLAFRLAYRPFAGLACISIALAIAVWPWVSEWAFATLNGTGALEFRAGTIAARLEMWAGVTRLIDASPIFGYGPEAIRSMTMPIEMRYMPTRNDIHPHSMMIQMWVDLGAAGVVLFVLCVVDAFRRLGRAAHPDVRAAGGATIAVLVTIGAVSHGMWQAWWLGAAAAVPALLACVAARRQGEGPRAAA